LTEPSLRPTVPHSPPDSRNEAPLEEAMKEDWSDGEKRFSEAIWISSPSTITPRSIRGTTVEAHINPIMEVNVLPWHLAYTLLGNVTLRPSDMLLRSCPLGHILKCRRITSAVPLIVDKIEVNLDFHIFNILDFDLLQGSPFEKLLISHRNLDKKLRKTASATVSCLENSMAKHFPEPNPLDEMMHESPFIPSESILLEVQNLPLPKRTTRKKSFTFVKMNDHYPSWMSLSLFPLAPKKNPSLLWRWTIIIPLEWVWASFLWPQRSCSRPRSRFNYDFPRCISWHEEPMGHGMLW